MKHILLITILIDIPLNPLIKSPTIQKKKVTNIKMNNNNINSRRYHWNEEQTILIVEKSVSTPPLSPWNLPAQDLHFKFFTKGKILIIRITIKAQTLDWGSRRSTWESDEEYEEKSSQEGGGGHGRIRVGSVNRKIRRRRRSGRGRDDS